MKYVHQKDRSYWVVPLKNCKF